MKKISSLSLTLKKLWTFEKCHFTFFYVHCDFEIVVLRKRVVPGLEIWGILVANATMFLICYRDSHVVANIYYCHKFMVLLI